MIVMLVDLDYFFAQVETVRNPFIKEKPVVVCVYSGRSKDSGAVSTANYIARQYGVRSGMPIFVAKKKLENIDSVFLPVDHKLYDDVSEKIMTILRSYSDRFQQVGIDEAYFNVSQRTEGNYAKAKELAQKIKEELKAQQGLTCSIGIGPNKLVAKIAADIQKPDGLKIVKPEQTESFLSPLLVDRLIGVGRRTGEKMQTLGIRTIGDLAKCDTQKLISVFGKKSGTYFHNASMGIDNELVTERGEAESVSRISTLKEDTRDLQAILEKTSQLCAYIHARLIQQGLKFKSVGILAVMSDMSIHSRSRTFENPTSELGILKETVEELFEKLLRDSNLKVRRAGVKISSLAEGTDKQQQLTGFINSA